MSPHRDRTRLHQPATHAFTVVRFVNVGESCECIFLQPVVILESDSIMYDDADGEESTMPATTGVQGVEVVSERQAGRNGEPAATLPV